jgi:hypothetical protein
MYRVRFLVGLVLLAPLAAAASDAPHDTYIQNSSLTCKDCHLMHGALGSALSTTQGGNVNLCFSCHTSTSSGHGFPWAPGDQAAPGSLGKSHSWSAAATNLGATIPPAPMGSYLESGNLACSVCHDQHNNANGRQVGTWQHVSYPVGVAQPPSKGSGGTLTVAVAAGSAANGYLIEIVAAGAVGTATYRLSNNGATGTTPWLGCSAPGTYVAYTGSNACTTGTNLSLNDGTNVKVTFAGTQVAGNQWYFYVGYPFYRIVSSEGEMCVACHANRNMTSTSTADGTKIMSHPVGTVFGANERSPAAILDANGISTQTGAGSDGILTNNIRLSPTNKVTCLSCHSMHNVDSNSLSSDPR